MKRREDEDERATCGSGGRWGESKRRHRGVIINEERRYITVLALCPTILRWAVCTRSYYTPVAVYWLCVTTSADYEDELFELMVLCWLFNASRVIYCNVFSAIYGCCYWYAFTAPTRQQWKTLQFVCSLIIPDNSLLKEWVTYHRINKYSNWLFIRSTVKIRAYMYFANIYT